MVGVYKITSPSGNIYIGQSLEIEKRFRRYRMCDCIGQPALYRSLKKYGHLNHQFQIIHELPFDVEKMVLNIHEALYYDLYKTAGIEMLNATNPVAGYKSGPKPGGIVSEETRMKLSVANKGKVRSVEHSANISKAKMGKSHRGVPCSEEKKRKISESNKGKKIGAKNPFFGKKHPPDVMEKISKTFFRKGLIPHNKGIKGVVKQSQDTIEKARLTRTGRKLINGKYFIPTSIAYSFGNIT